MPASDPKSIESILHQLNDGKKLTLSFPSKKEREAFRIALYKAKRDVDEVFLMTDPEFEISVLKFDKSDKRMHAQIIQDDAVQFNASLYLQSKASLQSNARSYNFNIIEVTNEEEHNGNQPSEPSQEPI